MGIFCRYPNSISDFEKLNFDIQMPCDTVLFVQRTTVYERVIFKFKSCYISMNILERKKKDKTFRYFRR